MLTTKSACQTSIKTGANYCHLSPCDGHGLRNSLYTGRRFQIETTCMLYMLFKSLASSNSIMQLCKHSVDQHEGTCSFVEVPWECNAVPLPIAPPIKANAAEHCLHDKAERGLFMFQSGFPIIPSCSAYQDAMVQTNMQCSCGLSYEGISSSSTIGLCRSYLRVFASPLGGVY